MLKRSTLPQKLTLATSEVDGGLQRRLALSQDDAPEHDAELLNPSDYLCAAGADVKNVHMCICSACGTCQYGWKYFSKQLQIVSRNPGHPLQVCPEGGGGGLRQGGTGQSRVGSPRAASGPPTWTVN